MNNPIETRRFSPTARAINSELNAGAPPEQILARLQELASSGQVPLHDIRSTAGEVQNSDALSPEQKQQLEAALDAMRDIVQSTSDPEALRSLDWMSGMDPFGKACSDLGLA